MSEFVKWEDTKARRRAADTRGEADRASAKAAARLRLDAYKRGHLLAELRKTAQMTQAEVAAKLGVTQSRISQIESGDLAGIDVFNDYVEAVGGEVETRVTYGSCSWRVA
jgi:DNA-binding XRE family transcriptional regulator